MPALIAYLRSFSFSLAPIAQIVRPTRSMKERSSRAGVCFVFGACGVILGNETDLCAGSARKYAAAVMCQRNERRRWRSQNIQNRRFSPLFRFSLDEVRKRRMRFRT